MMQAVFDKLPMFFRGITQERNTSRGRGDAQRATRGRAGEVFIVGAGPGDVSLLTMKAYALLQDADIVLFDALVSEEVLAIIPRHIKKQYVGKRCGKHSVPQNEICAHMVSLAQQGLRVVRLKGGDPAVFARTGEETQALEKASVPYAIVPGITAASGVSAYTGIPLTDRRCAQRVSLLTAHFKDENQLPDFEKLAAQAKDQTLVVYMGLSRLALLSDKLVENGLSAHWPVAVVENGTCKNQKTVTGTLSSISANVHDAQLTGPALLILGKVVEFRQSVDLSLLQTPHYVPTV